MSYQIENHLPLIEALIKTCKDAQAIHSRDFWERVNSFLHEEDYTTVSRAYFKHLEGTQQNKELGKAQERFSIIKEIMCATSRFRFVRDDLDTGLHMFYDNERQVPVSIHPDISIESLISRIVKMASELAYERGRESIKDEMRQALGI